MVRHGETVDNVAGILQGHLPGTLTSTGLQQADALGKELRRRLDAGDLFPFDVLLSSDLKRAADTSHCLNAYLELPLVQTKLLRERDWGALTGCTIASVGDGKMPEDVETVGEMLARARRFLGELCSVYDGKRVLAVSHGLFSRCVQAVYSGITIGEVPRMSNAEMRHISIDRVPDGWRCRPEEVLVSAD